MALASQLLKTGPRYARLLRSQYWSPEKLRDYTRARLGETLEAAASIPFYTAHLRRIPALNDFEGLPVLRRSDIWELNASVRSSRSNARFITARSSGSTGMPVEFLFDSAHQRGRFAARARYLRAHGWSPLQRSAWTSALPGDIPDGEFVGSRLFPRTEFLSRFGDFTDYAAWLLRLDPQFLGTLPSDLEGLLHVFEQTGEKPRSLRLVFCGSEVLDEALRERVKRTLGVDVAEYYGSTEAFLAWQCPKGNYHVNAEHVLLEIVDPANRPVSSGDFGRVLVTTLENHLMPLVRYEIGDYAIASAGGCPCGRTLPCIGRVIGRSINLFRMQDGRLLSPWRLVDCLKERPELRQFQIVQQLVDRYRIRYVSDQRLGPNVEASIRHQFQTMLNCRLSLELERVEKIARTRTGKFMTAISELATTS